MPRPSFQFYPGDWMRNANLRRCSHAERGVWVDVMCLMHDSEEYGVLRWPLKDIAQAVGVKESILRVLADRGVMKGIDKGEHDGMTYQPISGRKLGPMVTLIEPCQGPIWYSSRMVRDEHVREMRASNHSPKGGIGETFGEGISDDYGDGIGAAPKSHLCSRSKSRSKSFALQGGDISLGDGEGNPW